MFGYILKRIMLIRKIRIFLGRAEPQQFRHTVKSNRNSRGKTWCAPVIQTGQFFLPHCGTTKLRLLLGRAILTRKNHVLRIAELRENQDVLSQSRDRCRLCFQQTSQMKWIRGWRISLVLIIQDPTGSSHWPPAQPDLCIDWHFFEGLSPATGQTQRVQSELRLFVRNGFLDGYGIKMYQDLRSTNRFEAFHKYHKWIYPQIIHIAVVHHEPSSDKGVPPGRWKAQDGVVPNFCRPSQTSRHRKTRITGVLLVLLHFIFFVKWFLSNRALRCFSASTAQRHEKNTCRPWINRPGETSIFVDRP